MAGSDPVSRRDVELALIEKIDARLENLSEDVRDVRERVIRIEAQDVSGKLSALELRIAHLENWRSKIMGQIALVVIPVTAAVGVFVKVLIDLAVR